jgi:hypothetical protein
MSWTAPEPRCSTSAAARAGTCWRSPAAGISRLGSTSHPRLSASPGGAAPRSSRRRCSRASQALDGNIGIGGAPDALLTRMRQLLRPAGEVLVELAPPDVAVTSERIRLEVDGRRSRSFAWAYVGADAIDTVAHAAGFAVTERWQDEQRWFARLVAVR